MIGDHYHDKWNEFDWEKWKRDISPYTNPLNPIPQQFPFEEKPTVSRWEYEQLKREVEEMKQLLIKALDYDKKNNEPHCEVEDKLVTLRKIAELVGINLDDILGPKKDK